MRPAFTLLEVAVILVIVGILTTISIPWVLRRIDRAHVRAARVEVVAAIATARATAVAAGRHAGVRFDVTRGTVVVTSGHDTIAHRSVTAVHGVTLASNRDSLAYDPSGLGWGAANQTVVLTRGAAVDTIVISRLGRVR